MKFLVDAQLPRALCALLQAAGHDALHTRDLPAQNRTPDQVINDLSSKDRRVVVSKDTDFYYSHLPLSLTWPPQPDQPLVLARLPFSPGFREKAGF